MQLVIEKNIPPFSSNTIILNVQFQTMRTLIKNHYLTVTRVMFTFITVFIFLYVYMCIFLYTVCRLVKYVFKNSHHELIIINSSLINK